MNRLLVAVGDSIFAGGNNSTSASSATVSGTTATVASTSHGLAVGNYFYLGGASPSRASGRFKVASRVDANSFTFTVPSGYPTTVAGSLQVLPAVHQSDRNWLNLANAELGGPIKIMNHCAPGMTSDWVSEVFERDCLAYDPAVVYISVGTNDCAQGVDEAKIASNITRMSDLAIANGSKVIIATIPPYGPSGSGYTTTIGRKVMRVNRYLREYAAQKDEVEILDVFSACSIIASADWITGYSDDDVHPKGNASRVISADAKTILQRWYSAQPKKTVTLDDRIGVDSLSRQLFANPTMSGSTASPAGVFLNSTSGTIASNLVATESGSGAAVLTAGVARSDLRGYDLQVVFTGAANGDTFDLLGDSVHSNVQTGDQLEFAVNIKGNTLSGVRQIYAYGEVIIDSVTYTVRMMYPTTGTYNLNSDFDYYFKSEPFIVPSGTVTTCRLRFAVVLGSSDGGAFTSAAGTFLIGCPTITRLQIKAE
jgi:hypothetical protein